MLLSLCGEVISQNKNKDNLTLSFFDKLQQVIDLRKSFTSENETNKPALFSYKKDNDEKAVYTVDIAISYKEFNFDEIGVTPFVQFDYSTKSKDETKKITVGVSSFYRIYIYSGGNGKLEPMISYSKDFSAKLENAKVSLFFLPQFPKFFIPVRNVNNIKFKYDGSKDDNRWVFGFNPILGINFDRIYGGKKDRNDTYYFSSAAGNMTLKRYYLQFDLYGIYQREFDKSRNSRYKYEGTATFYFDEKERSSLNAKYVQEETGSDITIKITLGFGLKL